MNVCSFYEACSPVRSEIPNRSDLTLGEDMLSVLIQIQWAERWASSEPGHWAFLWAIDLIGLCKWF